MLEHSLLALSPEGFHHVFYREYGIPSRHTLIAAHGLTRNSSDFDFLAMHLEGEGFHVFAPDIVGRGKSSRFKNPASYNFPQYISDMVSLIARTGAEEVVWFGTSMGGLLGMILAAMPGGKSPIKCLILNDVGPVVPKASLDRIRAYAEIKLSFKTIDEAGLILRTIYKPFGIQDEVHWQHIINNSLEQQSDGSYTLSYDPKALGALDESATNNDELSRKDEEGNLVFWDIWSQIQCPILVIQGENSDILSHDIICEMKSRGPKFDHVVIPDVGHAPPFFAMNQILLIENWLKKTL